MWFLLLCVCVRVCVCACVVCVVCLSVRLSLHLSVRVNHCFLFKHFSLPFSPPSTTLPILKYLNDPEFPPLSTFLIPFCCSQTVDCVLEFRVFKLFCFFLKQLRRFQQPLSIKYAIILYLVFINLCVLPLVNIYVFFTIVA